MAHPMTHPSSPEPELAGERHWTAEHSVRHDPPWIITYNPTPGGRRNEDGSTSYSLVFPALHVSKFVSGPEEAMKSVALALNAHEALVGALKRISDMCPATADMSIAHMMAAEADAALALAREANDHA